MIGHAFFSSLVPIENSEPSGLERPPQALAFRVYIRAEPHHIAAENGTPL